MLSVHVRTASLVSLFPCDDTDRPPDKSAHWKTSVFISRSKEPSQRDGSLEHPQTHPVNRVNTEPVSIR